MDNIVIILVLAVILGGAGIYIYKSKKRGEACIGCPHAKECGKKNCSCSCEDK